MTPELLAAVIPLRPAETIEMPANLGRATHAWFLDRITAHDRSLARQLHEANEEKPFTVSNLMGSGRPQGGRVRLSPEQTYLLRITTYEPALTRFVLEQVLPQLPHTVSLAGNLFRRDEVVSDGGQSEDSRILPWVGRTTYADLVARHTLQAWMPARVDLRFASPAVFKSRGAYMPLPLPRLVFEGLARRWNACASVQIHPEINRYADECMAISHYQLRTERVAFGAQGERGAFPGFRGTCSFALLVKDRYWMGLIHLLAGFAFYAGVGKRTTMGLGQTRPVERGEG